MKMIRVLKSKAPTEVTRAKPPAKPARPSATAKVTMDQARKMRELYDNNEVSIDDLATEYGMSKSAIWHIIKGHTYKEVARVSKTRTCA